MPPLHTPVRARGRKERVELFEWLKKILFSGLGEGRVEGPEEVEEVVAEVGEFRGEEGARVEQWGRG